MNVRNVLLGVLIMTTEANGEAQIVESEITFDAAGRAVHGTLGRPDDRARHPAVLLIAGSGPTDRNWEGPLLPGANGSGRQLGAALAGAGYVVLRYDKLGTGRTGVPTHPIAFDDFEAEQRAALALLRAHANVDPRRIFVAGHSEGGGHAIRLVSRLPAAEQPAGLILLASQARTMRDTVVGQLEAQFRAAGVTGAALEAHMGPIRSALDDIAAGRPVDPTRASPIPGIQQLIAAFAVPASLPFARAQLGYDPAAVLRGLRLPVFILIGESDIQVPVSDARLLEQAARAGGNRDVTLHVSMNANHVFKHEAQRREALDPAAVAAGYAAPGRDIDADARTALLAWLARHTR